MSVLPAQTIRALCSTGAERPRYTENSDIGVVSEIWPDVFGASCHVVRRPTLDFDWWTQGRVLVSPYHERTRSNGKTFGTGPAGYDIRAAEDIWLWPFWGRLASAIERFDVPTDVTFIVQDKSSWARSFVFAMNTNAEPGWRGSLTLELVRFLPWPIRVRKGDPIVNVIFLRLEQPTDQPYEGKYQDQEPGPQAARYDDGDGGHRPRYGLNGLARRAVAAVRRFLGSY